MTKKQANLNFKEIGERIRIEREKLDLTREKFAEIIGLSPFYIGQIERGDRKMSVNTLVKISDSLHVSVDYLLKGFNTHDNKSNLQKNFLILESDEKSYKQILNDDIKELLDILERCSNTEINLIKDITKLILPHLNKKR